MPTIQEREVYAHGRIALAAEKLAQQAKVDAPDIRSLSGDAAERRVVLLERIAEFMERAVIANLSSPQDAEKLAEAGYTQLSVIAQTDVDDLAESGLTRTKANALVRGLSGKSEPKKRESIHAQSEEADNGESSEA